MSPIACGCSKNKVNAAGVAVQAGTYRVIVGERQVYESSSGSAAETVAARFDGAKVLAPGE